MPPNAWGDFFAGVSAPMAFLWLVVGYFQQGDELRQNTQALKLQEKALQLQVEELRASVEQQKHLVEVTRQDLELSRSAMDAQRRKERLVAQPVVKNRGGNAAREADGILMTISFENVGHLATDIWLEIVEDNIGLTMARTAFDNWVPGSSISTSFRYKTGVKPGSGALLQISYIDGLGERSNQTATVSMDDDGMLVFKHPESRHGARPTMQSDDPASGAPEAEPGP